MFVSRKTSGVSKMFLSGRNAFMNSNSLDGSLNSARHFGAMMRSVTHFGMSYRARRHNVVALVFVLCAWLVAAAMHLHVKDQDAGSADSAHCSYCFAQSASAAPASELRLPAVIVASATLVAPDGATLEEQTAPSFYLSRGPPSV